MRAATSVLLILSLLANAAPAWAADEAAPDPVAAVKGLEGLLGRSDATWQEIWDAYWDVKDATAAVRGDSDAVKARKAEAAAAYGALQPRVAEALRRENLSVGAWLMGFFGATLLWGGFAFCVGVARRAGKNAKAAA